MLSGLNQPKWDSIPPDEPIALQGCSHYNTSKNLKSKSRLNLRKSVWACFLFKICLPSLQGSRTYILLIPNFRQFSVPSVSGKDFRLKSNPKEKKKKVADVSNPSHSFSQLSLETSELVAIREQQTLIGKGKCLRMGKHPLTHPCYKRSLSP